MIDSGDDGAIREEKIIPDGYPEMIFHYKDPYFIDIEGQWQKQDRYLLAGQIRNHFFLKNSGRSGIFAIKLQPTALTFHPDSQSADRLNGSLPCRALYQPDPGGPFAQRVVAKHFAVHPTAMNQEEA